MSQSVGQFLLLVLLNGACGSVVIFGTYAAGAYLLLNAQHGAIGAWHTELRKLSVRLDGRAASADKDGTVVVRAPLDQPSLAALGEFVWFHEIINKVDIRLKMIRQQRKFAVLSVICGLAIATMISSPVLFGQSLLTASVPLMVIGIAAITTAILYCFFHLRHVSWWNRLRDRVSEG